MHETKREDPLTDMGYEVRDMEMKAIGKASIVFFGFVTVSFIVVFIGLKLLVPNVFGEVKVAPPFMNNAPEAPNPLLQTNVTTKTDIKELRQAETAQLTSSGVVDAKNGIYRIPIDRAIAIMSQRAQSQSNAPGAQK